MGRRLTCTVEKDFDLEHEKVSRPREMTVRYGGKCVECCIPAGEATLDYLEELEWDDKDDVIVEPPSRIGSLTLRISGVPSSFERIDMHKKREKTPPPAHITSLYLVIQRFHIRRLVVEGE